MSNPPRADQAEQAEHSEALAELAQLVDEVHVKALRVPTMYARDAWSRRIAPRLAGARAHSRETKDASRRAIKDAIEAVRILAAV